MGIQKIFDIHRTELKVSGKWNYSVDVSVAITKLRMELGLTQKQFAELVGMTQEAISRLESACCYPSIRTLERIARKTGTDLIIEFRKITKNGKIPEDKRSKQ